MAEKKKMSVAEIMAAARKADAKGGAAPAEPKPEEAASAAATGETEEAVAKETAPAPKPAAAKPAAKPALAPGQRPSVKDIMAMARAGGKGAGPGAEAAAVEEKPAPKPAEKPAAKPAAKAPKPEAPPAAGGPKDTASILAAARKSARPGPMTKEEFASRGAATATAVKEPPKKEKGVVPPMPAKPEYAKKPAAAEDEDRRSFLSAALGTALGLGFTALTATGGLWSLGFARFMFPNILTEPPSKFKVGFPDQFPPGYVETKFIAQYGVWVVKGEYNGQPQIYALRTVCTHLGCTPNWLEAEQKFKCPCHGSGFYKDGINFEGPAPRPLERYAIRLADDGQLEIDKSKLFQEELGQWNDPASFVTA
jgi:cytochrome b6-f complex iron-sulfur subunit